MTAFPPLPPFSPADPPVSMDSGVVGIDRYLQCKSKDSLAAPSDVSCPPTLRLLMDSGRNG